MSVLSTLRSCSGVKFSPFQGHFSTDLSPPQIQQLDNPNLVAISCIRSINKFLSEPGSPQSLYCFSSRSYCSFRVLNLSYSSLFFLNSDSCFLISKATCLILLSGSMPSLFIVKQKVLSNCAQIRLSFSSRRSMVTGSQLVHLFSYLRFLSTQYVFPLMTHIFN